MNCRSALFALAVFFISSTADAGNGLWPTYYPSTREIYLNDVLPPPPAAGSIEDKKDRDAVFKAQQTRDEQAIAEAQLDVELTVFRFSPVLGQAFTTESFPVTTAFFEKVLADEEKVIHMAKAHFGRKRPYLADRLLKPIVKLPRSKSYPSGHTSFAYVTAILLSKMLPEKRDAIFGRASAFANNRVVAGVHYPTDVQAGIISASVIVDAWLRDDKFKTDLEAAKKELRAGLKSTGKN